MFSPMHFLLQQAPVGSEEDEEAQEQSTVPGIEWQVRFSGHVPSHAGYVAPHVCGELFEDDEELKYSGG